MSEMFEFVTEVVERELEEHGMSPVEGEAAGIARAVLEAIGNAMIDAAFGKAES